MTSISEAERLKRFLESKHDQDKRFRLFMLPCDGGNEFELVDRVKSKKAVWTVKGESPLLADLIDFINIALSALNQNPAKRVIAGEVKKTRFYLAITPGPERSELALDDFQKMTQAAFSFRELPPIEAFIECVNAMLDVLHRTSAHYASGGQDDPAAESPSNAGGLDKIYPFSPGMEKREETLAIGGNDAR